jgi:hypothetical protein
MSQRFDRDGVTFRYPESWTLDAEDGGDGWTVTLTSPETAFLLVSLRPDADDPQQVADEALEALKAEYPQLDADQVVENVAGLPAVGYDIDFLTLDTSIACWTRCVDTTSGPLLVMGQTSEYDRAANEPVLKAICKSITLED